ncbi:LacI family transcriptional regulator [Lactococcus garvieae]|nr:Ribose operon repressor [Lactococcus petauri]MDC7843179.1 Ribose operon repressor [Lactococcus petauri]MDC7845087.1 Ribose operon repressor [Lactococcus petauri]OAL08691.1 LacI family transcriptional regulator [Lactococcus garvieae]UQU60248.1 Ribose operon repressor [Lactococcus petauri]
MSQGGLLATIKQVASKAGVSVSTVSRYITHNGYVSAEAEVKIKNAIQDLNYSPNISAQSLKSKKSNLVGLLLPDISNPFFPMLAKGVEEFLREKGYQLILGNVSEDREIIKSYLQFLVQSNAAGVITTVDFKEEFPEFDLPAVTVDRVGKKSEFGVFSDNSHGGFLAAKAVVEAGAQQIAVVRGPLTTDNTNERFSSSITYLNQAAVDYQVFQSMSYDFLEIQAEAEKLLKEQNTLDTIILPSDVHAVAYMQEIHRINKRIPEDIQLIGYDDILMSKYVYPALSTIHQPAYEMGHEAAQLIYKMANHQPIDQKQIKLKVSYVERDSTRKIKEN